MCTLARAKSLRCKPWMRSLRRPYHQSKGFRCERLAAMLHGRSLQVVHQRACGLLLGSVLCVFVKLESLMYVCYPATWLCSNSTITSLGSGVVSVSEL